jgi:hypothetical protein
LGAYYGAEAAGKRLEIPLEPHVVRRHPLAVIERLGEYGVIGFNMGESPHDPASPRLAPTPDHDQSGHIDPGSLQVGQLSVYSPRRSNLHDEAKPGSRLAHLDDPRVQHDARPNAELGKQRMLDSHLLGRRREELVALSEKGERAP